MAADHDKIRIITNTVTEVDDKHRRFNGILYNKEVSLSPAMVYRTANALQYGAKEMKKNFLVLTI